MKDVELSGKKRRYALIVDDSDLNREILAEMLEEDYEVIEASDGKEAIGLIFENLDELAIILLDLVMPEMGGLEVLRIMNRNGWMDKAPVLIISGETSIEVEKECFSYGVFDFLHKPFEAVLVSLRVKNATTLFDYKNNLEEKVIIKTRELQQMNEEILEFLGSIVEARSLESGQHVKRVKHFTRLLCIQLMLDYPEYELTPHDVFMITSTSALHDVGKIMISDAILNKPGKLTPEEFDAMKTHTEKGCKVLSLAPKSWGEEYYKVSAEICMHHHEKFDGEGYPSGLKGNDIPLSAQLVSVADCFDALTTRRVYKEAFTVDEAYKMILGGECGVFNPDILECFIKCRDAFEEMVRKNPACAEALA